MPLTLLISQPAVGARVVQGQMGMGSHAEDKVLFQRKQLPPVESVLSASELFKKPRNPDFYVNSLSF